MKNIEIIATGKYLPVKKVDNTELSEFLGVTDDFIFSRTGIETRYYAEEETIDYMAKMAVKNLIEKSNIDKNNIEMIVVATTTSQYLMPGISYKIQDELKIEKCFCLDILAGCAGYINAFDIARMYIATGKCKNALIVGVDLLSKYTNKDDISNAVVLSDGAGATFIQNTNKENIYESNIVSDGMRGEILTCNSNDFIYMNGKEIYKYAVTETVNNINQLIEKKKESLENIKYIIPHQANIRIIDSINSRLKVSKDKIYKNIDKVGNTFCASIPIALNDMFEEGLLKEGDKIILLGYGGGLNTGSILMEV